DAGSARGRRRGRTCRPPSARPPRPRRPSPVPGGVFYRCPFLQSGSAGTVLADVPRVLFGRLRMSRMRFAKGHGTENDFVILPDPDGALDLSADQVARLCDRRAGIGGDGVLRVVRTAALEEPVTGTAADGEWFMDYRNADGSIAEMCGNGVRVFARYLLHAGLVDKGPITVGTRAGARRVEVEPDGDITVDMGLPEVLGTGAARLAGGGGGRGRGAGVAGGAGGGGARGGAGGVGGGPGGGGGGAGGAGGASGGGAGRGVGGGGCGGGRPGGGGWWSAGGATGGGAK